MNNQVDPKSRGFAVRWRLGGMKNFNERMSRWHGTSGDGIQTECGLMVPVIAQGQLPETYERDDYKNKITCKKCQKSIVLKGRSHAR
ncbi:hypothetical protein [Acidithiobacillus sulfurivorans]|uniref:Uncharacterized protein n=1 Tax=Acidithiobacillus sulfurivorans TaxID=1958756 RepID=A0ABS5ZUF1_9PROT|nr:hypothetical protein [Acidithiobacillus sulfurivorans]MBU2758789.1 hypothetical protein [Acidithiobacillus sulfurivorans]